MDIQPHHIRRYDETPIETVLADTEANEIPVIHPGSRATRDLRHPFCWHHFGEVLIAPVPYVTVGSLAQHTSGHYRGATCLDSGVRVAGYHGETCLFSEVVWASEVKDLTRRNRLGELGAYIAVYPPDERIDAAVARAIAAIRATDRR